MAQSVHLISIAAPFRQHVEDMTRPPSALLYVGGYLQENGFPVTVHHIRESELPATLEVIESDPDTLLVGLSMLTGTQVASSAIASEQLKQSRPDMCIVWGGIHPSIAAHECLSLPYVDYVVIGEGEITCLELARHLSEPSGSDPESIKGLGFKRNGRIILTEQRPFEKNLDRFRQDWSLVDPARYLREDGSICYITSRGCPHSCGFCYNQQYNRRIWRKHSVELVVREIKALHDQLGFHRISFDDDNFLTDRNRALEILNRLSELGITCTWLDCRVDYITEELIAELQALGVESIFVGWESGNDETLQLICKGFTRKVILERLQIIARYRELTVDASGIVGFPWETEEQISRTNLFALKMFLVHPFRLRFNLGVYVPYPGSPILDEAFARGFAFPTDPQGWRRFDILSGDFRLPWLSEEQIRRQTIIDRYSKTLYAPPGASLLLYTLACLSFFRILTGILILPFENDLCAWVYRKRARMLENERRQERDGTTPRWLRFMWKIGRRIMWRIV
jgi:radical SAM superfamily enzyme YgiQ (UPF0313 family)